MRNSRVKKNDNKFYVMWKPQPPPPPLPPLRHFPEKESDDRHWKYIVKAYMNHIILNVQSSKNKKREQKFMNFWDYEL